MLTEILQELQNFSDIGIFIVVLIGGFWVMTWQGWISFDFRSKDRKKEQKNDNQMEQKIADQVSYRELLETFNTATQTMKQMSNDNMHELSNGVLKVVDERFKTIETLIQNEVIFGNRNLVSGIRDEIKTSMNGWATTKADFNSSVGKFESVVSKFERMCNKCRLLK